MSADAFSVNTLVIHTKRPDWGPGKIVHISGSDVFVVFRDDGAREARVFPDAENFLRVADSQSDPILENLPPLREENGRLVLPRQRITLAIARNRFLRRYPLAFRDEKYLLEERNYKWQAHELFLQRLGQGQLSTLLQADNVGEITQSIFVIIGSVNLLASFEEMAVRDALKDASAAKEYALALERFLGAESITASVCKPYFETVCALPRKKGGARVAAWPVATLLPYLAQPDRHMFLKPTETKEAAESLGFDLHYDPTPNWETYEALLRMGEIYRDTKLADLAPRDFIDVQSFMWVASR